MGILRVVEWRSTPPVDQTDALRRSATALAEIADHRPDGVLDDRGITAALARAGLLRLRDRTECRHLHRVLGPDENVIRVGRGHHRRRHGILVVTTDRLLFIDKNRPTTEPIDQFPLASVASISIRKSRLAETLVIHTAARRSEISHLAHGQAGGIAAALRHLTSNPPQQPRPGHTNTDPATQTRPSAAPTYSDITQHA